MLKALDHVEWRLVGGSIREMGDFLTFKLFV